jgi:flagellar basal-body rod protein FlgB
VLDGLPQQIENYMDLLSARQKLVASNIANATTPGYKTKDIDFQEEFENSLAPSTPIAREIEGLKTKNDGNNVSIDREARMLSENALRFNVATQLMRSAIKSLKNAIEEGKSA